MKPLIFLFGALAMITACNNNTDNSSDLPTVEEIFAELDAVSGEVVENTEVTYADGESTVNVGGLEITVPVFADYAFGTSGDSVIPPQWPTLSYAEGWHYELALARPAVGFAVFSQTTLVTDEANRVALVELVTLRERMHEAPVAFSGEIVGEVSCWFEVRIGPRTDFALDVFQGVLMIAGEGLASSAVVVSALESEFTLPLFGDIVQAACGTRPEGM